MTTVFSNLSPGEMLNACYTFLHRAEFTDPELKFIRALNDSQETFGTRFRITAPHVERLTQTDKERITPFL